MTTPAGVTICLHVCLSSYLRHTSWIKPKDLQVAAGVDPWTMPASLARVQHAIRVVLTVGQLRAQEHLHTSTHTTGRITWISCCFATEICLFHWWCRKSFFLPVCFRKNITPHKYSWSLKHGKGFKFGSIWLHTYSHNYLLASRAGEVVDGTPDSPVDQDPGLELFVQTCDVFIHFPTLLSANVKGRTHLQCDEDWATQLYSCFNSPECFSSLHWNWYLCVLHDLNLWLVPTEVFHSPVFIQHPSAEAPNTLIWN